jgi:hypothetical protein
MSIQRKYSLPNCTLILDGWGNDITLTQDTTSGRPLLSMLTSFECRLQGHAQPIKGGREFFEQFITTVSAYAQQFLSGVPRDRSRVTAPKPVVVEQLSDNTHRIIINPQALKDDPAQTQTESLQFDLMTVHLFDLVEAIDQFYADVQTLPDLTLALTPISRRQTAPTKPVTQRVIPAAIGVSGLAAAAIALFYVPVPEFRPTEPEPQSTSEVQTDSTVDDTPNGSDTPENESEDISEADAVDTSAPLSAEDEIAEALFVQAPLLVDPDIVDPLMTDLQQTLLDEWTQEHDFEADLVYRLAVAENGDILGYKYVNDAALANVDETPLPDLQYNLLEPETAAQEPVAQYRVVFTPAGGVEVSLWHGRPPGTEEDEGEAAADTTELGPEITDSDRLATMNFELYDLLLDQLEDLDEDELSGDLSYRVNMTPAGVVVDYEALDDTAADFLTVTGIPELAEDVTDADRQSEQGQFLVVITEEGVLEISPWRGF